MSGDVELELDMKIAAAIAGSLLLFAIAIPVMLAASVATGFMVASGLWH